MGSGLFIGTGQSLAFGGPANMVIAYALVVSCVWAVLQTLAEMTISFPVSGNIFDYADRWVDPSIAFAAGFAEWLGEYLTSGKWNCNWAAELILPSNPRMVSSRRS